MTPGFRNSRFPESPELRRNSGFPEFRVTPETRSSGRLLVPSHPDSKFPESPGTPSSRSHPNSGFPDLPGVPELPGDSGNPDLRVTPGTRCPGQLREPGIPGNSGNTEFWVTPGNQSSGIPLSRINIPIFLKSSHSSYLSAFEDGTEYSETSAIKFRRRGITQKKAYNNV